MKIKLNDTLMISHTKEPMIEKEAVKEVVEGKETIVKPAVQLTLFAAVAECLGSEMKDDQSESFKEKVARIDLAESFLNAKDGCIHTDADEIAMIEKRCSKRYPAIICWAIKKAFEKGTAPKAKD